MSNKKHPRDLYRKNLGRHEFSRADILEIERIMKQYANAYDERMLNKISDYADRERMRKQTRKFADLHVSLGAYIWFPVELYRGGMTIHNYRVNWYKDADSIRFLNKRVKVTRYFKVSCDPTIRLEIRPFSCTLYANRQYATGKELKTLNEVCGSIDRYVSSHKRSLVSNVRLL